MNRKAILRAPVFVAIVSILSGCASYTVKPMPTMNPTTAANHTEKDNLYIAARVLSTAHECRAVFSDNLVGGGYIPVEVSFENMGQSPIILYRQNITLISRKNGRISPVSPTEVAEHFSNSIVGGALVTGVFGIAAAEHANHKRESAFHSKGLRKTTVIANGNVVDGFLYFKGKVDQTLPSHISISFNPHGKTERVDLPVK